MFSPREKLQLVPERRSSHGTATDAGPSTPSQPESPPHQPLSVAARAGVCMAAWYFFSGCTLFGNKHILSALKADPNLLAMCQMMMTATFGAVKMYGPWLTGVGPPQDSPLSTQPMRSFLCDMALVGLMRFVTVVLGLISLKYVAVSFTETIKSSAPFFTVVFARIMLREHTSFMAPALPGLARLVCATRLASSPWCAWVGATLPGARRSRARALLLHRALLHVGRLPGRSGQQLHAARSPPGGRGGAASTCGCAWAVGIDCVQNVFSKKLLSTHYNYINLQFYTSAAALVVQLPFMLYLLLPAWLAGASATLAPPSSAPPLTAHPGSREAASLSRGLAWRNQVQPPSQRSSRSSCS